MTQMLRQCASCYGWSTGVCPNCNFSLERGGFVPSPITDPKGWKKAIKEMEAKQEAGGTKHDDGKVSLSLVPRAALEAEARVYGFGAKKYGRDNYKKGFKYTRLIDAALRHIAAALDGEDNDPESGESHLAHARCCIGMLMEITRLGTVTDDRFKKEAK